MNCAIQSISCNSINVLKFRYVSVTCFSNFVINLVIVKHHCHHLSESFRYMKAKAMGNTLRMLGISDYYELYII